MARRFHPETNIHENASKMTGTINHAKEGLKITIRNNYAIREEARVSMAEEAVTLLSDDNSDSETSEHNSDNEETPLKKNPCWTMDIKKRSL